jgi:septal ring factor EnvC (AmiA/AmiB activator)
MKANEIKFPTNGNCKHVKDLTTGKEYGSITETAIVIKVTAQAVSNAIKNKTLCKGHRFILVKDLHDNIDVLCEESAKANARAAKAEAKLSEMEELRAKAKAYDQLMAEQEAKRKAEEARLEKERKKEEKRQEKITKLEDKIERLETLIDRKRNEEQKLVAKRNKALEELKALDNGKEVE